MDKTIVYRDTYKGIAWEINHIERDYAQWWTYYIFLHKDKMLPEEFKLFNAPIKHYELGGKTRKTYDYNKIPDVFDFHGGCTFYEKDRDIFLGYFLLKIGCDYNHYMDEPKQYQLEDILFDVKKSIDNFLSKYSYKRWCGNCGEIFNSQDGIIKIPDETSYAFKCNKCAEVTISKRSLTTKEI